MENGESSLLGWYLTPDLAKRTTLKSVYECICEDGRVRSLDYVLPVLLPPVPYSGLRRAEAEDFPFSKATLYMRPCLSGSLSVLRICRCASGARSQPIANPLVQQHIKRPSISAFYFALVFVTGVSMDGN